MTVMLEEPPIPTGAVDVEPLDPAAAPQIHIPQPRAEASPTLPKPIGEDDINRVANGIAAEDMPVMIELARLAHRGKSAQILRALELVRVNPTRAKELRDKAEATDPARRVLSAALAVKDSGLVRQDIQPTPAATPDLYRNAVYTHRRGASMRATRTEAYKIDQFRYYAAGCLAIVAAGARIPFLQELRDH